MSGYRLAVCAEMVFLDLPFAERVRRIAALGFEVEMWGWATKDIAALSGTGATFSSMTGYLRGTLADPAGAEELLATARQSLEVAERLDCPRLNVQIGEGSLVRLVERALPWVGEIQVADVPGRCEPGTGEIHYPAVAAALHRLGYQGVVGLEGWAAGEEETALASFRRAFS
ncbi:hypothetical protein [Actinoplanes auranticolor]|uniref:Xylose isomerase-like TIM barrel protein n=1 Tax=Actinoplanes auranticolor TaxID=47988 RepID=A0A919VPC2_9ACTN|nr:hypothetical protein [Actinoplanes auranticolor]GIM63775.1 hypothetical protein Aau02nite_06230 [Actinoplanes auranticolor]